MNSPTLTGSLIEFLENEVLNGQEVDLTPDDDLLGSGLVDSMGMMRLIGHIEEVLGITIPPQDMVIENFMTVQAIDNYIVRRKQTA